MTTKMTRAVFALLEDNDIIRVLDGGEMVPMYGKSHLKSDLHDRMEEMLDLRNDDGSCAT